MPEPKGNLGISVQHGKNEFHQQDQQDEDEGMAILRRSMRLVGLRSYEGNVH
jgi:hypothetical protein